MIFSDPETYKRPLGSRKSICVSTSQKITSAPRVETQFPTSKLCAVIASRAVIFLGSFRASSSREPRFLQSTDQAIAKSRSLLHNELCFVPFSAARIEEVKRRFLTRQLGDDVSCTSRHFRATAFAVCRKATRSNSM